MKPDNVTSAAYDYVDSKAHTADDKKNIMWFGWALREAFIAGAKWQADQGTPSED